MGHPLVAEFCRSWPLDPSFLRRCQRVFREEVQPQLDELERVTAENARLKDRIANPPKRPRGRPRKNAEAAS